MADIRDLWPDALAPTGAGYAHTPFKALGYAIAQELRLADVVVGLSDYMLKRAPASRTRYSIPIGMQGGYSSAQRRRESMSAVFVGSFSDLFDFRSLFDGWRMFVESSRLTGSRPQLSVYGYGKREEEVKQLVRSTPLTEFCGRVLPSEVPSLLGTADVGIVPIRSGHGTHMTNKVFEYLSAGSFVLHTLNEESANQMEDLGLRVEPVASGWQKAFGEVNDSLYQLRGSRDKRRQRADLMFGREALEGRWLKAILMAGGR